MSEEFHEEDYNSDEKPPQMKLHTILLQNNSLHEIPPVLKDIPSLRVIQLHGNPCAENSNSSQVF